MDAYLAIASKREVRNYADRPVPAEVADRILDAGRLTGSSMNRQPWRFVVLESPEARETVAETVYAPGNLTGAALAVAVVVRGGRTGPGVRPIADTGVRARTASCPVAARGSLRARPSG